MNSGLHPSVSRGLNLHVYPATIENASRLRKVASSLQHACQFAETHIVGLRASDLPYEEDVSPGTRIVRLPGTKQSGNLGRFLKTIFWQPRVFLNYRNAQVSVVAAHSVWVMPICAALARRTGAAFVYNPHELETETSTMRGLKQKVARAIERRFIAKARIVSTVNESIAGWYEERYQIPRPIAVTNVPEFEHGRVDLRAQLGIPPDSFVFVHTGYFAEGRNIPLILRAFAGMPDKHLIMIGDGLLSDLVKDAVTAFPNIHSLPPVPSALVVANMRGADVGVCLTEQTSQSQKYASPNKFFESLCAGTPCLVSELVEARRILGRRADRWTVSSSEEALRDRVTSITRQEIEEFRADPPLVGTWGEQVAPLARAYQELVVDGFGLVSHV